MLDVIDRIIKFWSLVPMNTRQYDKYDGALEQILTSTTTMPDLESLKYTAMENIGASWIRSKMT